ncbi:MAG TPA: tRNA lysidine(34) synthetase TilS [Candidatus Saccharimonadia bacterium]|nr:tRNA lysidine(34) synthetase TilS [Candidatus Saccharimonadia bacterium]
MNELIQWPPPGRYILAISGGADSMVLLHLMAQAAASRHYELVVAHFDHGLRATSAADAAFVATTAARYGLPFEQHAAHLGRASEAAARTARHDWLQAVRARHHAAAVLIAHHADDQLETSLLNLARGSGRLGLAPMALSPAILRPLIGVSRTPLRRYAVAHKVSWREDPTNADLTNPRNLLRHRLLAGAPDAWRAHYLGLITELAARNTAIDETLGEMLSAAHIEPQIYSFSREVIHTLTLAELQELILATARRLAPGVQLDRRLIAEVAAFARTGRTGTHRPLRQGIVLMLKKGIIVLTTNRPL